MRIQSFFLNLFLILVLMQWVGCKKNSSNTNSLATIKVQLNWVPEPEFGGLYAAREQNFYKNAGLNIEIIGGGASSPVVQLVATGQVHFGVAAAEDVLVARARGADIVAVFATFQSSPQAVMVHASRNLTSLADLKSGILALETGSAFATFLRKKYGFQGVQFVPSESGITKFLLDTNYAQQCYVTSEPIVAQRKGISTKVFQAQETGFNPYSNVIITRREMLKENFPLVRAFLAATLQGWQAYLNDPKPTNIRLHTLNSSMDNETLSLVAEAQRPLIETTSPLGSMNESRWTALAKQLVDIGLIPNLSPANGCFQSILIE